MNTLLVKLTILSSVFIPLLSNALEIKDYNASSPTTYRSVDEAALKIDQNNNINFFIVKNDMKEAYFVFYGCQTNYSNTISGPDIYVPPPAIIEELGRHTCKILDEGR